MFAGRILFRPLDTVSIWPRLRLTGVRSGDSGNPLEALQNMACDALQETTIREDLKLLPVQTPRGVPDSQVDGKSNQKLPRPVRRHTTQSLHASQPSRSQSVETPTAEQDRSKMPDRGESSVERAL